MAAERPGPAARPRLGRPVILLGACAAAVGLAAVLVTAAPAAPPANAAEVLQRAAQRASTSSLAGAGTVAEFTSRDLDMIDTDAEPGPDVAVLRDRVELLKIPRGDEAWLRKSWTTRSRVALGDAALVPDEGAAATKQHPFFESSRIGAFVNDPAPRSEAALGDYPATIRDLPREPRALLEALRADGTGHGARTGWGVLQAASTVLRSGVADSGLQAAVFTALQRMPDLAIVDAHATDLDGRTGVAIGLKPGSFDTAKVFDSTQLLIDPATGQYLGLRDVSLHAYGVVPAGTELWSTAMRTDVATTPEDWVVPAGSHLFRYP